MKLINHLHLLSNGIGGASASPSNIFIRRNLNAKTFLSSLRSSLVLTKLCPSSAIIHDDDDNDDKDDDDDYGDTTGY